MANPSESSAKSLSLEQGTPVAGEVATAATAAEPATTATATATNDPSTQSTAENAIAMADELNASLLQSDHEHKLSSLQQNHDILNSTCSKQQKQISELQAKVSDLQSALGEKSELLEKQKQIVERAGKRAENAQEMEKDANERMARFEVQSDSLRHEIRYV